MLIEEKSFFLSDHWKGAQGPHFNWMNNAHTKILLFQRPKTFHVIYLCLRHKSCKKNKENTLISKTKPKRISIFIVALFTVSVAVRKWNLAAFKRPFVCNCNRFITFYGTEIVNSEYLCAYFSLCSASILLRNLFVFVSFALAGSLISNIGQNKYGSKSKSSIQISDIFKWVTKWNGNWSISSGWNVTSAWSGSKLLFMQWFFTAANNCSKNAGGGRVGWIRQSSIRNMNENVETRNDLTKSPEI